MGEKKATRTEDRRVKRTKRVLKECLFELLEAKSIDEISVKELTEAADINRSTFYFYYNDISDMMMQIQNEIFEVFEEKVLTPQAMFVTTEDFTAYCRRFLEFLKEYENICKFVISNDPNNFLAKKIKNTLLDHIPDSSKVFPADTPEHYLTCFAMSAFWNTIIQWMYDGMKVPADEMARFLANVYFYGGRTFLENRLAAENK